MNRRNIRLKSIWLIYSRRIINKKNALLTVLIFILMNIYISPVKGFSELAQCKVSPWIFPFLVSDANFLMLFMAGVIYFYSNLPFMQRTNSYYFLRIGRARWILEQIVYIIISALIITSVSAILSIIALLPHLQFERGWGKVLYTLAKTDAGDMVGMFWNISLQYIRNQLPIEAMAMTIFIVTMGITFLGMLMFLCSLYFHKIVSVIAATVMVIYSSTVANVGHTLEKKFAMFSPVSWMRVTRIDVNQFGYRVSPSSLYIISTFIFLIFVLILLLYHKNKSVDFIWDNEEE